MCGIFAAFNYHGDVSAYRQRALQLSKKIRHRGPDWSGCIISGRHIFCHERLSIVGIQSGAQPLTNEDKSIILTVNGEIYNHKSLRRRIRVANPEVKFKTQSDCEVILHLYQQIGDDVVNHLDGVFSFVLYDVNSDRLIAARDAIGVTTLYYGFKKSPENGSGATTETIYFASEMKSLREECYRILSFPPGHIYDSKTGEIRRWYNPKWFNEERIPTTPVNYHELRVTLERAVRKRLMSEVPFGVLLSGGLDSSLIAAIAAREITQINSGSGPSDDEEEFDESALFSWPRLHSFSIGLPGSPDLLAAREVATYLGTIHHENTFTIQEGLDAISDVIYHLETYDVTTVRASTPMYLLSRKIKAMGVKMVLSGEGSDEIFGGYLYFHQAPDAESLHKETVARVKNLHTSDCLRANKSTMAWGLEARVPFLDKTFLDVSMSIDPREKMSTPERMEKYILRKAFDITKEDEDEGQKPYLPSSILWRQKEQFSDGVGYSWIDSLKLEAEGLVSDEKFENRANRWPNDTPTTKEAYWYREAFEKWFPEEACIESIVRWIPRKDWGCSEDPSGRAQKVHCEAYDKKQEE